MKVFSKRHSTEFGCQKEPAICFFLGACSNYYSKLEHLEFQLADDWQFSVPPEDYLLDYSEADVSYCILGISAGDFGIYILGDAFLRSYLTVYDFTNEQVGIAIHRHSNAYVDKHPERRKWQLPLIVTVTILFAVILLIFLYKCYKNSQIKRQLATAYVSERQREVDRRLYGARGD